jgi:predicted TIM-barrel fold metal-dependent hydrolase
MLNDMITDSHRGGAAGVNRIVDVDVHVRDMPGLLAPYAIEPWRKSLELMAKKPYNHLDVAGLSPGLRADPPYPGGHQGILDQIPNAGKMREGLDMLGIDDAILMPDNLLYLANIPNIQYSTALMHAYNRWLTEEWVKPGNGLWAAVIVNPHDPEESVAEIERYAMKPGVKAIYYPTAGINPLWGSRRYDKIHAAAEASGLPVLLHSVGLVTPSFPHNMEQFENIYARHVITHPFSMMANMTSLMHTGVPNRFPGLRFIFTEAGVSWVPHIMWRLDRYHSEKRNVVPFLEERPSDYIKRQMWFATQPLEEPDDPRDLVEQIRQCGGAQRVMFASDWPHHDFDHPRALNRLPLKPEDRNRIMWQNAVEVFDLPPLPAKPKLRENA